LQLNCADNEGRCPDKSSSAIMAMMEADKEARQRRKVGDIAYIMS
jgi:hypothetical protein